MLTLVKQIEIFDLIIWDVRVSMVRLQRYRVLTYQAELQGPWPLLSFLSRSHSPDGLLRTLKIQRPWTMDLFFSDGQGVVKSPGESLGARQIGSVTD